MSYNQVKMKIMSLRNKNLNLKLKKINCNNNLMKIWFSFNKKPRIIFNYTKILIQKIKN